MFIVEGPDGAGKTTLIEKLQAELKWPIAPRVVSKETKALVNLAEWTDENLSQGFQSVIYDRHRLISDPIYRFLIPGKKMDPELYNLGSLAHWYRQFKMIDPVTIYCLPPLEVVKENIQDDPDNAVVYDHIELIYYSYVAQAARHQAHSNFVWVYDYTTPPLLNGERIINHLSNTARFALRRWERKSHG